MMRKTTGTLLATLLLAATGGSALSAEVTVMISGGFKAALEKLAPAWEKQTGNHLVVIPGPSMGKTPQAIPNRLARGEHADVVIMVGDALTSLEKAGRTQPDSRRELADSPIGVVVKAGAPAAGYPQRRPAAGDAAGGAIGRVLRQRQRTLCQLDAVPHPGH
ncbi:Hypothetical ABC transport system, periplasmic component [Klebsiella pneumoniae subsp. pneumoniae ST512-K30BO]|nr:Hypothetical ABC transport system, periplasmic component [Klebsiella pneumoniae subsp. pneumoniae ST512-K30BO]